LSVNSGFLAIKNKELILLAFLVPDLYRYYKVSALRTMAALTITNPAAIAPTERPSPFCWQKKCNF
jgi:hypothetical protein